MSTEVVRLRRLLDKQERDIVQSFNQFLAFTQSPEVISQINQLLAVNDVEGALQIVDQQIVRFSSFIPAAINSSGAALTPQISSALGVTALGLSFDPSDSRTAQAARENRLQFIQQATKEQRDSIRYALSVQFEEGAGPRKTAAGFRDAIGLTLRQEQAIQNYKTLLETGSREALRRDIRDRRFDRTINRKISQGEPLSQEQIDKMVSRYRERYKQYRAENIARTEGLRAMDVANREALRQVMEDQGLEVDQVERVWHVTRDARTRDAHRSMEGQVRGVNEPFLDGNGVELMYPGDPGAPPETTINCRCVVTTRRKRS